MHSFGKPSASVKNRELFEKQAISQLLRWQKESIQPAWRHLSTPSRAERVLRKNVSISVDKAADLLSVADIADPGFRRQITLGQCTFRLRDRSIEIRVGKERFLLSEG